MPKEKIYKLTKVKKTEKYRLEFNKDKLTYFLEKDPEAFHLAFIKLKIDFKSYGKDIFISDENEIKFLEYVNGDNKVWKSRFNDLKGNDYKIYKYFTDGFLKSNDNKDFVSSFELISEFYSLLDKNILNNDMLTFK